MRRSSLEALEADSLPLAESLPLVEPLADPEALSEPEDVLEALPLELSLRRSSLDESESDPDEALDALDDPDALLLSSLREAGASWKRLRLPRLAWLVTVEETLVEDPRRPSAPVAANKAKTAMEINFILIGRGLEALE